MFLSRKVNEFPNIDLTPGVLVPFHRYPPNSHQRFSKSVLEKVKSIKTKSIPIRNDCQSFVHNVTPKMHREHLSHQLTELIRINNKPLILNDKLHQQNLIINSTRKWILPSLDMNQLIPITTNYIS